MISLPAEAEAAADEVAADEVDAAEAEAAVEAAGADFAYVKATEGADISDPNFAANWSGTAQAGMRHGLVNLGGDVRIVGPQPDGAPWRIGVRHPRRPGELCTTLELSSGALATSGDYERCIVIDGVRHGHVLNPRTGWPVQGLASVSVVAPLCVVAGSATTIAMLMERDGPAWLAGMALPHLWIDTDGACGGPLAQDVASGEPLTRLDAAQPGAGRHA